MKLRCQSCSFSHGEKYARAVHTASVHHYLPHLRASAHGNHAHRFLFIFLRVCPLQNLAQAQVGRLLRVLQLRHRQVPTQAG